MALPKHAIETSLREFFKATIAGGLLFLLPMVLILTVLRHAIQRVGKLTKPIADLLPFEAVLGVRREAFLAVLLPTPMCFTIAMAWTIVMSNGCTRSAGRSPEVPRGADLRLPAGA